MIFEQYYLDCLSQASYLIGDETTGRAVVVDPRRDIDEYVSSATDHDLEIELIIETHFHADFLSGHLELADATGAEIGFGEVAEAEFDIRRLGDGERISLGEVTLEIRATPGHTPESISVVVYENSDDEIPYGVLTGDALFIGDVGRPDLLASAGVSAEELGGQLYDSLHQKLMTLPDITRVFPAHGAGSACGKNLSTETQSTIGEQRVVNYAVQPMSRGEFVDVVTEGQPAAPGYFGYDAALNKASRELLDETELPPVLSFDELQALRADGAVLIDAREGGEFAKGHLAGAINVGLGGRFAEYVGGVVAPDETLVVVTEQGTEMEVKVRLGRIGFDRLAGVLDDPYRVFFDHQEDMVQSARLSAEELRERVDEGLDLQLIDVRNPGEVALGMIDGAASMPLPTLRAQLSELDAARPVVVNCAGGYRSMIASSLLSANGFDDVSDLLGGYGAWISSTD